MGGQAPPDPPLTHSHPSTHNVDLWSFSLRNCGIPHFYIYFTYSAIPGSALRCGTAELRRNSAIPYFVVIYLFCNSGFRVPLRKCGNPPEFRSSAAECRTRNCRISKVFCIITLLIMQFRVPRSSAEMRKSAGIP